MDSRIKLIVDSFGFDRFKFNQPLKDYSNSYIEGLAKVFFIAFTEIELMPFLTKNSIISFLLPACPQMLV